jgi:hypothetical protein
LFLISPHGEDDEMFGFGQQLLLDTNLGKMILTMDDEKMF